LSRNNNTYIGYELEVMTIQVLTFSFFCISDIPDHMIIRGKYGRRYYIHSRKDDTHTFKDIVQCSEERQKSEKPSIIRLF
jgi:hypothetical protein